LGGGGGFNREALTQSSASEGIPCTIVGVHSLNTLVNSSFVHCFGQLIGLRCVSLFSADGIESRLGAAQAASMVEAASNLAGDPALIGAFENMSLPVPLLKGRHADTGLGCFLYPHCAAECMAHSQFSRLLASHENYKAKAFWL
jgi:hypothetical protein